MVWSDLAFFFFCCSASTLHGCTIGDESVIGMNALVFGKVESQAQVASGRWEKRASFVMLLLIRFDVEFCWFMIVESFRWLVCWFRFVLNRCCQFGAGTSDGEKRTVVVGGSCQVWAQFDGGGNSVFCRSGEQKRRAGPKAHGGTRQIRSTETTSSRFGRVQPRLQIQRVQGDSLLRRQEKWTEISFFTIFYYFFAQEKGATCCPIEEWTENIRVPWKWR